MKMTTRDITILAIMTALALVLSIFDNMLSLVIPVPLPGFKIGIANIVTLFLVMYFSLPKVICVIVIRCFLSSLYSGGITVFLISLAGGILSAVIMYVVQKIFRENISPIGISIFGAAAHNTGQVLAVMALLGSAGYFYYLGILLIVSLFTGAVIGLIGKKVYPRSAAFAGLERKY